MYVSKFKRQIIFHNCHGIFIILILMAKIIMIYIYIYSQIHAYIDRFVVENKLKKTKKIKLCLFKIKIYSTTYLNCKKWITDYFTCIYIYKIISII